MKAGILACLFCFVFTTPNFALSSPEIRKKFWNGDFQEIISSDFSDDEIDQYYLIWSIGLEGFLNGSKNAYNDLSIQLKEISNTEGISGFIQAEAHFVQALLAFHYRQELDALVHFRSSYRLANKTNTIDSDSNRLIKTRATIHLLLGSVPKEYTWLLDLLGWKGSVATGLQLINEIDETDEFGNEARLIRILYTVFVLDGLPSNSDMKFIQSSDIPLVNLVGVTVAHKLGFSAQPFEFPSLSEHFSHVHYFRAESYLRKGDYPKAIISYELFLKNYKGFNLTGDSRYKIYVAFLLNNKKAMAQQEWEKYATEYPEFHSDKLNVNNPELSPSILSLLKARLAMDGGYFDISENYLKEYENNKRNKGENELEYLYRKARLFHKTNNIITAEEYYRRVIRYSSDPAGEYFLPNSCLQLGAIMESKNRIEEAKKLYEQVLGYTNYPYRSTIERKAKAHLSRITQEE